MAIFKGTEWFRVNIVKYVTVMKAKLALKQDKSDKTTVITTPGNDTKYPTEKAVTDALEATVVSVHNSVSRGDGTKKVRKSDWFIADSGFLFNSATPTYQLDLTAPTGKGFALRDDSNNKVTASISTHTTGGYLVLYKDGALNTLLDATGPGYTKQKFTIGAASGSGSKLTVVGSTNQVNISATTSWGLLLGQSDDTYDSGYHHSTSGNDKSACVITVGNDALHLGASNSVGLTIDHSNILRYHRFASQAHVGKLLTIEDSNGSIGAKAVVGDDLRKPLSGRYFYGTHPKYKWITIKTDWSPLTASRMFHVSTEWYNYASATTGKIIWLGYMYAPSNGLYNHNSVNDATDLVSIATISADGFLTLSYQLNAANYTYHSLATERMAVGNGPQDMSVVTSIGFFRSGTLDTKHNTGDRTSFTTVTADPALLIGGYDDPNTLVNGANGNDFYCANGAVGAITLDLGAPEKIYDVIFTASKSTDMGDCDVEVSDDGTTWTLLRVINAFKTNVDYDLSNRVNYTTLLPVVTAKQHIRLKFISGASSSPWLYEILLNTSH
jgi:hypothetical protein